MAFDALVVGLMAALIGSALFVAYRSGASWRGWAKPGAAGQSKVFQPDHALEKKGQLHLERPLFVSVIAASEDAVNYLSSTVAPAASS